MSIELQSNNKNEKFNTVIYSTDCKADLKLTLVQTNPS